MTKINGWKRIGIIASLVWIIGAYLYAYSSAISKRSEDISSVHVTCDADLTGKTGDAYTNGFKECNKQADDSLSLAIRDARLDGVLAALVPVPLGWGFAYLVLFTAGWVRRGFMQ